MDELTGRLTATQPLIMGGSDPTVEELRKRTGDLCYVLIVFTETRGSTEVGFPLDWNGSDISSADFDNGTGSVHLEGNLILNCDHVRCVADIDLATLKGTGRLVLQQEGACTAE